jgi:hypothetical protein
VRYLLGDSAEFREQYNFLATLKGFIACAGRVSQLHHDIQELTTDLNTQLAKLNTVSDQVAEFCDTLVALIKNKAREKDHPEAVGAIANQQVQALSTALANARNNMSQEATRAKTNISKEIDKRRHDIITSINSFLSTETMPIVSSSFSMQTKDGTTTLLANFEFRGGITASFELDPNRAGEFRSPVRVGSISPDLNVQVGQKRKFLSKDLTPVQAQLDNYYITTIELAEGMCHIKLRRKLELTEDSLVLDMRRKGAKFAARITNLEAEDQQTTDAEPSDFDTLNVFWGGLSKRIEPILAEKQRLRKLRLDGNDVFKNDLIIEFIERLIDQFAPIVATISDHSSNDKELSLKIERGDGRREELYVRKKDLAKHVLTLPDEYLERFAILDIFPETEEVLTEADLIEQPQTDVMAQAVPGARSSSPPSSPPDQDLVALADELIASGDDIIEE